MNKDIQLFVYFGVYKMVMIYLQCFIDDSVEVVIDVGVWCYGLQYLWYGGCVIQNLFGLKLWCGNVKLWCIFELQLEFFFKGSKWVFLFDENFLGFLYQGDGNLVLLVYVDVFEWVVVLVVVLLDVCIKFYFVI